jgi:peptidoglycan/xylan/chitin deacetylase (PgdA/CDA1 family)
MAACRERIMTFHGLGEPPPGASEAERAVWVPAHWLEAIVAAAPVRGLSFCFDDGNASDVELALPILQANSLSARFFILAGRIGRPGHLTAEDVVRLHGAGMPIGSHGLEHRDWCSLTDAELRSETVGSRTILTELIGEPVTEAACPFGSYDRRVLKAVRDAGYERMFTSDGGPGIAGATVMPRTSVGKTRALEDWLVLAAAAGTATPRPLLRLKRLAKRLI